MKMKEFRIGEVGIVNYNPTHEHLTGIIFTITNHFGRTKPYAAICGRVGDNSDGWDNWDEVHLECTNITNIINEIGKELADAAKQSS